MTSVHGDTASLERRPWVRRLQTPEQRAAQLTAEERTLTSERRWDLAGTLGICFGSCTIGVLLVGWSVHTTDDRWALPAFWAGLSVGNSGILAALLHAFARAETRRDL